MSGKSCIFTEAYFHLELGVANDDLNSLRCGLVSRLYRNEWQRRYVGGDIFSFLSCAILWGEDGLWIQCIMWAVLCFDCKVL